MTFSYAIDDFELRLIDHRDAKPLFELIDRNRKFFEPHLSFVHNVHSAADIERFIPDEIRWLADREGLALGIHYQNKFIGQIIFIRRMNRVAEIAYFLDEAYTGRGIMTKAVRAIVDYGFQVAGLHRMFLKCSVENPKSCAIPERLGFHHEGIKRDGFRVVDRWYDMNIWAVTADEWDASPPPVFSYHVDDEIELHLLDQQDAETIFQLIDTDRDHLRPWMPWVDPTKTVDDTKAFIQSEQENYANNKSFNTSIWYKGTLVGLIGYVRWDFNHANTEIGYWLSSEYTGRGIMTRSTWAMLRHAFTTLGMRRVEIRAAVDNIPSNAIPERLGFNLEMVERQAVPGEGGNGFADVNLHAILSAEWQALQEETS